MVKIKKLLALAMATMMLGGALAGCSSSGEKAAGGDSGKAVKVGVCLYKFDDTYISTVRQSL
ncbi:MAG: galactose ABC transporter substrate-binding protein, partial [Clostridium baratii]|nr:galactose ABC transporter substrate-binding protein [Clostridium baratii]